MPTDNSANTSPQSSDHEQDEESDNSSDSSQAAKEPPPGETGNDVDMTSDSDSIPATSAQDASVVVPNMEVPADTASDDATVQAFNSLDTYLQGLQGKLNGTAEPDKALFELFVPDNPAHNNDLKTLRGGRVLLNPPSDNQGRYTLNDYLLHHKIILARFDYDSLFRSRGNERYLPSEWETHVHFTTAMPRLFFGDTCTEVRANAQEQTSRWRS
ncbi:hypothetical protein DFQ27_001927, partial [Actinomortierella ambigua]